MAVTQNAPEQTPLLKFLNERKSKRQDKAPRREVLVKHKTESGIQIMIRKNKVEEPVPAPTPVSEPKKRHRNRHKKKNAAVEK